MTMSGRGIISIGEALYDMLAVQRGVPKEEVTEWIPYPGGAPANVVTGVCRLSLPGVRLATALGADKIGDDFVSLLESRDVDTSLIQRVPGKPTRDVLVTRTEDGERTFAGFGGAAVDGYADCYFEATDALLAAVASADVVVTGTLWLAFPRAALAVRRLAKAAAEGGKAIVVVDVNWRPVFWVNYDAAEDLAHGGRPEPSSASITSAGHHVDDQFSAPRQAILEYIEVADVLKVTDEEAEFLFGIPAADALASPEAVLRAAPAKTKAVLVSAGEHGSAYAFATPGGDRAKDFITGHVPLFPVKVADTTGAGDSYLAGFLSKFVEAGSLEALASDHDKAQAALEFASACGAFTCTGSGAIAPQPTAADAQAILDAHRTTQAEKN